MRKQRHKYEVICLFVSFESSADDINRTEFSEIIKVLKNLKSEGWRGMEAAASKLSSQRYASVAPSLASEKIKILTIVSYKVRW